MDHQSAIQLMAVEKYVLNELPPDLRDEFEEHFFGCQECAIDLRATTAFLDLAKQELAKPALVAVPASQKVKKLPLPFLWRPAFAIPALAAALLVIAYQNVVVYPHLSSQVAELHAPQVLPVLSLGAGTSRGEGDVPATTVHDGQPFLLNVDIPAQDRFSSYAVSLYGPAGDVVWKLNVSAVQAKDTLSIQVPPADVKEGSNVLLIQGIASSLQDDTPVDLVRHHFNLRIQK